jgi:hypothetical protein
MPVELATKIDLINLAAAKALGLTLPPSLLALHPLVNADEIEIELVVERSVDRVPAHHCQRAQLASPPLFSVRAARGRHRGRGVGAKDRGDPEAARFCRSRHLRNAERPRARGNG